MTISLNRTVHFLVALAAVAFGLNLLWEMAQMPAFGEISGWPWRRSLLICAWATLGDMGITIFIYCIVALVLRRAFWAQEDVWIGYFFAAALGAAAAIAIEWHALATGRWGYGPRMPILAIPFIKPGIGALPLLQLTLLTPLAIWIATILVKRFEKRR